MESACHQKTSWLGVCRMQSSNLSRLHWPYSLREVLSPHSFLASKYCFIELVKLKSFLFFLDWPVNHEDSLHVFYLLKGNFCISCVQSISHASVSVRRSQWRFPVFPNLLLPCPPADRVFQFIFSAPLPRLKACHLSPCKHLVWISRQKEIG